MKNYFNQYEASNHLIIMTAMLSVQNLLDGQCLTENEKKTLKKVIKLVNDFSESVYARLGQSYVRSLKHKAELNTLKLVSRNVHHVNNSDMEDFIDSETLVEMIELSAGVECVGCKKTEKECLTCGWYKVKSYLHHKGSNEDNGLCPFIKEKIEIPEINFD